MTAGTGSARCWAVPTIAYDAFLPDTWLNRILKAGCRRMLELAGSLAVQQQLHLALSHLQPVSDVVIEPHHFERVHLTRATERFGPLLDFCRMVLEREAPSTGAGQDRTFSLLFPMEAVFEGFIAGFVRRHALELGLSPERIRVQARGDRRHLLRDEQARRHFRLIPDLIIEHEADRGPLIVDTKWKRLEGDRGDRGVSQADLYQVYTYLQRYHAREAVLLYPAVPGVRPGWYGLEGDAGDRRIRVELVDVRGDPRRDRQTFLETLGHIVGA
jgi:5-methylcytosine-specific restriction enzyme subunit McrC